MTFRLVLKSVTLNDLEGQWPLFCTISPNLVASEAHYVKGVEDILKLNATEM